VLSVSLPIPPTSTPPPQSTQFTVPGGGNVLSAEAAERQVPGFLNCHHTGSTGDADSRTTRNSTPSTPVIGASRPNHSTSPPPPGVVAAADALFATPASPKQWSQRRFTPGGVVAAQAGAERATRSATVHGSTLLGG